MKWEYFGTGLALLGIAVSMVLALPPPWWPSMPRWMVRGGLFLGLALLIYGVAFTAMGIWPDNLRPRLWPIVGMATGLAILVVSAVWFSQISKRDVPQKRSALDGTIRFECLQETFNLPADGKLLELVASDNDARTVGFQSHWLSEFAYKSNPSIIPTRYGMIDKCRIVNFGTAPVFNIRITVDAVFSEQIPIAEKTVEQRQIDRKTFHFLVDQVDAGQNNGVEIPDVESHSLSGDL
jgi:hypothetical protein